MRKLFAFILLCAAVSAPAAAREPSEACASGEVPPSATPAGVGARQAGDPHDEPTSVYVCGSSTPAPARGQVWLRADTRQRRVHVIADGDSDNGGRVRCADGYNAVRAGDDGAKLYRGDDGTYSFNERDQQPDPWARGAVTCAQPSRH